MLATLRADVAAKLGVSVEHIQLKYVDDEKDVISLCSDASLSEAVAFARKTNLPTLKLTVDIKAGHSFESFSDFISKPSEKRSLLVGTAILATVVGGLFAYLKGKK